MGVFWTASIGLMLAGAPLVTAPVENTRANASETELPPQRLGFPEPRDGRMITYFSTACCGTLVCGGCSCIPVGVLIPLVLISTQSIPLIAAGAAVGGALVLLGLVSSIGGAGGYAAVLITLHSMGLWDSQAAAQSCSDVLTIFSVCWSVI